MKERFLSAIVCAILFVLIPSAIDFFGSHAQEHVSAAAGEIDFKLTNHAGSTILQKD